MRKVKAATFVSIDGVMQAPGGPDEDRDGGFELGGWTVPHFDEVVGASIGEAFAEPFDLLLGRRTYDIFAGHWPRITTDPASPRYDAGEAQIAVAFNACTKYVATHRPEALAWQNTEALGPDVVARVRALKAQDGPTMLIQGSSQLIQQLLRADLIDEVQLLVFPIVLGRGKRLFGDGAMPAAFSLATSTVSPSGAIVARYVRAGDVKTGSFALA